MPVPEKRDDPADQNADLKRLQSLLEGRGGESQTMQRLLSHVVTQVSDEGLVIEVFDTSANPLFATDTDVPTQTLTALSDLLADVMAMTTNKIAVEGYVRAYPVTLIKNPSWDLSTARAQALRQLLQQAGLDQGRIARVSGHADRHLCGVDPDRAGTDHHHVRCGDPGDAAEQNPTAAHRLLEEEGARLFSAITGDHFTILGLPLLPLLAWLGNRGMIAT
jgi:outer membrane protein OmpA-like peptidoglycan-associated protein